MLSTCFSSIPQCIFIAVAIFALPGIFRLWRDRPEFPNRPLLLLLLCMIFWRGAIEIISSRHAALLIFPAVILSAGVCLRPPGRKYIHCPAFRRAFSAILLGGLVSACLIQLFHSNPYRNRQDGGYRMIREYAATHPENAVILTAPRETHRAEYYTGLHALPLNSEEPADIRKQLTGVLRNVPVVFLELQSPITTPSIRFCGKAECQLLLFSSPVNRRRKRFHNIYVIRRAPR